MKLHLKSAVSILPIVTRVTSIVTLSPEQLPSVLTEEKTDNSNIESIEDTNKDNKDWYILPDNSDLICDKKTGEICHPLEFKPESDWKEILPLQMIPPGLNVRMNLETGLKEAKLRDLNISPEELENETNEDSLSELHEFKAFFDKLEKNVNVEETLEELIDFSHDYKHGFKIIQKEQNFIINQLKKDDVNDTIKDLYLRLLTSCLRNNPPAKEMFFIKNVDYIVKTIPEWINKNKSVLLKRCINILQNVAYKASPNGNLIDNLELLYTSTDDLDNKIKILEIFADLEILTDTEGDQINFHFNPEEKSIVKRNMENKPNLQAWFREYCDKIQSSTLDDFYVVKFIKTIVKFKDINSDLKPDDSFMKWIAEESMKKFNKLEEEKTNNLETRDLEKESFDKDFIRIRHEVFGNKMASRIKVPLDEL